MLRRAVVLVLAALLAGVGLPAAAVLPGSGTSTVEIDAAGDAGALNRALIGFNWRDGGEVIGPLEPNLVRIWSVNLSRVSPAPGVYDWALADEQVATVRELGGVPLIVLIGRPPWADSPGSAGYEQVVAAAVARYGVEQVPDGAEAAWFESGNEPEFAPTAHGQLLHEMPVDTAAQARAVAQVEADTGQRVTWGGPGALFADPPVIEAFAVAAETAGRPADYLSWHSYTNQPFLGPDGAEFHDPASLLAYEVLRGRNPVASPRIIGVGTQVMRTHAQRHRTLDGHPPAVVLTEWHLSAGGMDHRHDTHEGAAHTLAALIELQTHGADASTFFAATDRHCPQDPNGPDPLCGDWGTATADGQRKPTWWAFDWWRRLDGTVLPLTGDDPEAGLWALATRRGNTARVLLTSFSVSTPQDRTVTLEFDRPVHNLRVRRLDSASGDEPATTRTGNQLTIELPANTAVLVEAVLR